MNLNQEEFKTEIHVEKLLEGHTNFVLSILHFDELGRIVTTSFSSPCFKFWNDETFECVCTIEEPSLMMVRAIKWDSENFLAFGSRSKMASLYHVKTQKKTVLTFGPSFDHSSSRIDAALKVSDDVLLISRSTEFHLIEISSRKKLKTLKSKGGVSWLSSLILSKKYPDSFYFPDEKAKFDNVSNVIMVNINTEEKKIFKSEVVKKKVFLSYGKVSLGVICIYNNLQNEEILVVGFTKCIICFYNTIDQTVTKIIDALSEKESSSVGSFAVYKDSYLFVGESGNGDLFVVDLLHYKMLSSECINGPRGSFPGLTNIKIFQKTGQKSKSLKLLVSSFDSSGKIVEIRNLPPIIDRMGVEDLRERIEYLLLPNNEIFGEKTNHSITIIFNSTNFSKFKFDVFKTLF